MLPATAGHAIDAANGRVLGTGPALANTSAAAVKSKTPVIAHAEEYARLKKAGVAFVRVLWCDTVNLVRTKVIPLRRFFEDRLSTQGIRDQQCLAAMPVTGDEVLAGSPSGDLILMPDMSTLCIMPYYPSHASVFCFMYLPNGQPFACDTRALVARVLTRAKQEFDLTFNMGFELEFTLFMRNATTGAREPLDKALYAENSALDPSTSEVLDDMVMMLEAQGIAVEAYHKESAPGQYEIVLKYKEALAALDDLVRARTTLRHVAKAHGLECSFIPKPFSGEAGNSNHCHISESTSSDDDVDSGVASDSGHVVISQEAQHFMAGVLHRLMPLTALLAPSYVSYERLVPQMWSGAFTVWGHGNKEAAVRAGDNNFEVKTLDGTANPHLALAGVLAAGLDGLRQRLVLPPPLQDDPATLTQAQRNAIHCQSLPSSLLMALTHLKGDALLADVLGPRLLNTFLRVKEGECKQIDVMHGAERYELFVRRY
ncbi:hypothetical protein CXG81DRAFT_14623 [Caulochytrium protostelioides]|uniref:Glutamine synthetase n=1 Tax=Caulochytrium protostelioides TaxID=1555241 RepID=A0A4P9X2Y0_9FUNG|nr:hypothetical protein CXG81DRAFT_14623 [Caulochytrium protostelioides]|eukprot:RKO99356.1 hypothetical protein CXG81DRAFT_14623 [Caulochytrium protostelioides]